MRLIAQEVYSITVEEGIYRAIVDEVNPNQPEINLAMFKVLRDRNIYQGSEKYNREHNIPTCSDDVKTLNKLLEHIEKYAQELSKKGIVFDASDIDFSTRLHYDLNESLDNKLEMVERCLSEKELNLENGDKLTLEGAIEYGVPLNLVGSKGEKITTKPVTYVKIE